MEKEQNNRLEFKSSGDELTLGVEVELQVLDQQSLRLTPRAESLLSLCDDAKFDHEFFQSTIEIKTGICADARAVTRDLKNSFRKLHRASEKLSLAIGASGTHPLSDYRENLITAAERYAELIDRNQWMARRMAVYGMHIHLAMRSGDECVKTGSFFLHLLPHVLALSASSPFWQGKDTGLCACRPTTYEALPTAGMPYMVKDWKEFQRLYKFLIRSKSIRDMKDLWWDVRPSPRYGTLELRFCDQPGTLREISAIAAFVHLLAHWFREHEEEWTSMHAPLKKWVIRENKWRTLRFGLRAQLIHTTTGKTKSLADDIHEWLDRLAPLAKALGYERYIDTITKVIRLGNSAARQRSVFTTTNDVSAVVSHIVDEFRTGQPRWVS